MTVSSNLWEDITPEIKDIFNPSSLEESAKIFKSNGKDDSYNTQVLRASLVKPLTARGINPDFQFEVYVQDGEVWMMGKPMSEMVNLIGG